MSDAKPRPIDPRFDPRFQRGYVPDAAGPAPELQPSVGTGAPPTTPAPTPAPSPAADAPVVASAASEREPLSDAQSGSHFDPRLDPVFAGLVEPSGSDAEGHAFGAWFIAGWGVALVATVLGIALWSSAILSQDPFSGPSNESDRWLQTFGWMVAPSLIEAGLLGVVAMLVWTGLRHVRRDEEPA